MEIFRVDANRVLKIARECILISEAKLASEKLSVEVQMSCLFEEPAFSLSCFQLLGK